MVIDDEIWSRLEKLLPKSKGRHGKDDRLFMEPTFRTNVADFCN